MPYNTRRKSLSLPSLGIHLPVSQASRQAAAAEKLAIKEEAKELALQSSAQSSHSSTPHKRQKSSHSNISSPVPYTPSPAQRNGSISMPPPQIKVESRLKYEHTPPPSPEGDVMEGIEGGDATAATSTSNATEAEVAESLKDVNMEEVNDEIVEAVMHQLVKTGNRPHLVKELATVLGRGVRIVEISANPSAIISSRLSTYLKRSCWNTTTNPCPLAKELETVHPRRTYFYLTTCPHQAIPDPATSATLSALYPTPQRSIISPSLSGAESSESRTDSQEDEQDAIRRRQLSPSPEVDLSSPEFDDEPCVDDGSVAPPTPSGSFSGRLVRGSSAQSSSRRGASPPLEKDEREFTLTARGMQRRKMNGRLPSSDSPAQLGEPSKASKERDLDGDLFGEHRHQAHLGAVNGMQGLVSSPAMKPTMLPLMQTGSSLGKRNWGDMSEEVWIRESEDWDSRSPEMVGLEELDGMLYGY